MEESVAPKSPTTSSGLLGRPSIMQAFIVGLLAGGIGWLLTIFFRDIVIKNIFCRTTDMFSVCSNGGTIAWTVATIIVVTASIFALMRVNVYRPLLVVIAVVVALWGVGAWLLPMVWWMALLWNGLIFGLAYATFSWLASHEKFILSLILVVAVVVVARLFISL